MTILHTTDFHFNQRWFDWLPDHAPAHDLLVLSGDLLDLSDPAPHQKQIAWVSDWIADYPHPLCVCSGNHDLEWDAAAERWTPAYWLRALAGPRVWTDGQRLTLDGLSVLSIGCTTRPKGGDADIWVVHAPPAQSLVAIRSNGRDAGDPDLVAPIRRHTPRVVLSGHVHDPFHWCEQAGPTFFLNPGRTAGARFPNHVLLNTQDMSCQLITATKHTIPRRPEMVRLRPAIAGPAAVTAPA